MPLSGITGYVKVNGVKKTGDKWSADLNQQVVDRSNFMTEGEPSNAPGQRTGQITFEGPYEGVLGMERGIVYAFTLGNTAELGLVVNARVSAINFSNDKDSGPRFKVTAAQYGPATVVSF